MPTLLHLPNEILLQIIEEARPDGIKSFVWTCKKIQTLGAKTLMQHVEDLERYDAPVFGVWDKVSRGDVNPYAYLSDILLKPRRALYVNHLFIHDHSFTITKAYQAPFTEQTLLNIDEVCGLLFSGNGCPYIKSDEVDTWVEKLRWGDTKAAACLFLTLLPELKTLSISHYSRKGYVDMIYEISKANQSPHRTIPGPLALHKLDTIIIDDAIGMNRPGEKFGIYETCMTLPSLRVLKGQHIDCNFDRWPSKEDFPLESNVTDIEFQRSAISAESFARLLTRTETLQRFTYGFSRLVGITGDYTAKSLKKVLEQFTAHSLTHLDLSGPRYPVNDNAPFIGSLRRFKKLKHLRVQCNVFINYTSESADLPGHRLVDLLPLLPASLETFNLLPQATRAEVTYTLDKLRKKRKDCLPHLTKITCESRLPIVDGLLNECASVGIELVYPSR